MRGVNTIRYTTLDSRTVVDIGGTSV